ncbi:MAG TPA: hypothetical protein VK983_05060 [Candidatus Limnocylindrales bacterium]|nr:hypothetical protein [Candidatus Limnocylindrales bacterium]
MQVPTIIIDSCGLIDGRIEQLVAAHMLLGRLVVPDFIIDELHILISGESALKQRRSEAGLGTLVRLQTRGKIAISETTEPLPDTVPVDDRLLLLAQELQAYLYTIDQELIGRAVDQGICVVNVNSVTHLLQPMYFPGDRLTIELIKRGERPNQAVGYTAEGIQVVVDHAARYIGSSVVVECRKVHQTTAGRMIFARLV